MTYGKWLEIATKTMTYGKWLEVERKPEMKRKP